MLSLLILFVIFITGCSNKYKNYKQVDLPDNKLGSIKIPNNWELFTDNDGWMIIKNSDDDSIIAKQYYYGENYLKGSIRHDSRVYNPYFDDYSFEKTVYKSGNSNQCQWGVYLVEIEQEIIDYMFLRFGPSGLYYYVKMIIIDEKVDSMIIENIAKSYSSYE